MTEQMANKLRDAIRNSGVSLLAFSKLCGVPQPQLFHFMNGKDIRLVTAQKLADYLGFTLVKGPPKNPPKPKRSG